MKLTKKWLEKHNACQSGINWYMQQGTTDFLELCKRARDAGRFDDFRWCYVRMVPKKTAILWACNAAELALPIYEKKYPVDDRPRKAIEAARTYAGKPTAKNRNAADAAYAAAAAVAYAAAYAADAARKKIQNKIMDYGIKLLTEMEK